jgi:hypothetical protein
MSFGLLDFEFGPKSIGSAIKKAQKNRCNKKLRMVNVLFIMGFILLFTISELKLRESSLYFHQNFYQCPDCADEKAK